MAILEKLVNIIAPHQCLSCGDEGKLVCDYCAPEAFETIPSRCYKCRQSTENFEVCMACRKKSPLRHVWVSTEYDKLAKELVYIYKFGHTRGASQILVDRMISKVPFLPNVLVVSIPTATTRVRERGFDHSTLLAKQISGIIDRKYIPALMRLGQTRQVGMKRQQRQQQMKDAYRAKYDHIIKGAHILLVDDIVTSGATIEEAARAIRRAGASKVDAVVFAQKQ